MGKLILAIDQGTTGSTAMLYDIETKTILGHQNQEYKQHYPRPSWVEHDLNDIWESVTTTIKEVIKAAKVDPKSIIAIGITNQRETTCVFNNAGEPIEKAIVWQDRRTASYCQDKSAAYKHFQTRTGLPLDPYFSGTKLNWLIKNSTKVAQHLKNDDLKFGTIDTYLLYRLTAGQSHYTEPTNASRTLLMDLKTCDWDKELLNFFEIPASILPEIKNTFDRFGQTSGLDILPDGIPITCLFGDQQSALFGQAATDPGELKCTYGTGAFLLLNTGTEIKKSENGLLTTVAYKSSDSVAYALEGSTYIAGAAVQFLRDNLKFFTKSSEVEALAKKASLSQMEFLYFFPFFTGIGSPYWNADAKGCLYGMTRDTELSHISRACLEGISLSINDLVVALEKDLAKPINEIRVDGGACANNLLMQIQSNFSNKKIIRPVIIETTAFGAILGSLIGLGKLKFTELKNFWKKECEFSPEKELKYYSTKQLGWEKYCKSLF